MFRRPAKRDLDDVAELPAVVAGFEDLAAIPATPAASPYTTAQHDGEGANGLRRGEFELDPRFLTGCGRR